MYSLITVASLLLSVLAVHAEQQHFYVKPTLTSSGCPQDELCMTLSDYLQRVSEYFTSNTAIHFLPGNHTISELSHELIVVSNAQNLSLSGSINANDTILHCAGRLGFAFLNITNLEILNIRMSHCGDIVTSLLTSTGFSVEMHPETKAALVLVNIHSLMLQNVQIEASYGYGLLGVNVLGESTVTNCIFTHNMWRSDDANYSSALCNENKPGGNAIIIYDMSSARYTSTLHISQCEFAYGNDTIHFEFSRWSEAYPGLKLTSGGSGLGIIAHKQQSNDSTFIMTIHITGSLFHHNNALHGPGGNMLAIMDDCSKNSSSAIAMYINNCTFHDGKSTQGGGIFVGSISIPRGAIFVIRLSNSTITNNSARTGGGLCIEAARMPSQNDTILIMDNCLFSGNEAIHGAAVHIAGLTYHKQYGPWMDIIISQTAFLQNVAKRSGGGIDIISNHNFLEVGNIGVVMVGCIDCSFVENKAESGYAVSISDHNKNEVIDSLFTMDSASLTYFIDISLINSVVRKNGAHKSTEGINGAAAFYIHDTEEAILNNSIVVDNNGSAVYISRSELVIIGVVNITGNHGVSGGGLYFDCNAFMYLRPNSQLHIANNTASFHGGAIAVQDCSTRGLRECFIQLWPQFKNSNYNNCSWFGNLSIEEKINCSNVEIIMENNTAQLAGNSIYGGSLETCYVLLERRRDGEQVKFDIIQNSIFEIRNTYSLSEVASNPCKVCFCDKNFNMNKLKCLTTTQAEVYPGQTLKVPAVGVGQFNNTSPALVRTKIAFSTYEIILEDGQTVQGLGQDCGLLIYHFKISEKHNNSIQLHLSVDTANQENSLAIVHLTILNCPPGFELSNDFSTCGCEPHLKTFGIKCDIQTQTFNRPGSTWIGYYRDKQVTVHNNCPFRYCKSENKDFILDNQDDQCAFNHSGVLCGACQQGLSLGLGTSQCLKCSNVYLFLLIPFALAGVALVFLLLKCNLTVSVGSINGLIFYANIIQVNHSTFFPQGVKGMSILTNCLSVFIAWLNLDFGIQTCFFNGMSAYTKTWLQFVFPAYVWMMVGFIIYGSRYYPIIFRLIGSNAVQVLATLFLLTYAKLLRTVISVFYSTALTGRNSSTPLVWLMDGNVPFFSRPHAILLLMALLISLIYILPFTFFIFLAPCLQANSNRKALKLVNKLKPLLDAYQGPFKDKFRYWTGLLLLIRATLFAVFVGNIIGKPEMNLFTVIAIILLLQTFYWNAGRVYKNMLWDLTESFYLLNLAILTAATLLLRSLDEPSSIRRQEVVTDIMVGAAFAVFSAILLYHLFEYLLKTSVTLTQMKQAVQILLRMKSCNHEQSTTNVANLNLNNTQAGSLFELREPLLSGTFDNN